MIIGVCGLAGSGKDTVADFLVRDHGFVKVALADPLKRICRDVFDFTDEQLWGPSEKRNIPDERYHRGYGAGQNEFGDQIDSPHLTPRYALQQLGTEWGRNCYPNVWVDYALRVHKRLQLGGCYYDARTGLRPITSVDVMGEPGYKPKTDVVISDVRFLNEVAAILKAGGEIWKVERPGAGLQGAAGQHVSEQELQVIPAKKITAILDNDQTLDHLRNLVGLFLERSKA